MDTRHFCVAGKTHTCTRNPLPADNFKKFKKNTTIFEKYLSIYLIFKKIETTANRSDLICFLDFFLNIKQIHKMYFFRICFLFYSKSQFYSVSARKLKIIKTNPFDNLNNKYLLPPIFFLI